MLSSYQTRCEQHSDTKCHNQCYGYNVLCYSFLNNTVHNFLILLSFLFNNCLKYYGSIITIGVVHFVNGFLTNCEVFLVIHKVFFHATIMKKSFAKILSPIFQRFIQILGLSSSAQKK